MRSVIGLQMPSGNGNGRRCWQHSRCRDTPQVFTVSYIYRLPLFAGARGWPAAMAKGWQTSGTTLFQSGVTYHFHTGSDAPGYGNVDGNTQDRPNILNPSLLGKSLDKSRQVTALLGANTCGRPVTDGLPYLHCAYFNTNIPPGGCGNLGMNTFRKDGTANWNVALGRNFRVAGERSLDVRGEFSSTSRECNWPLRHSEKSPTLSTRGGRCSSR
jgi:hypothetical protein